MNNILEKFKNIWVISIISITVGLLILVFLINLFGGIKVSQNTLKENLEGLNTNDFSVAEFKMKVGSKITFVAKNLSSGGDNFKLTSAELSIKRGLFSKNISSIEIKNTALTIYVEEDESFHDIILNLKKLILGNKNSNAKINSTLIENFTLNIVRKKSLTSMKISNFTGSIDDLSGKLIINGAFQLGSSSYKINLDLKNNANIMLKLESQNIILKTDLTENKGKLSFSIGNLTKLLNEITPDTINFDLSNFDSIKNAIYFESEITYNDVRKNVEFFNSKLQLFGNKEEEVKISNLSNDTYKISLNINELILEKQEGEISKLNVEENIFPPIQFSFFLPNQEVLFSVNIETIVLKRGQVSDRLQNFALYSKLGSNEIQVDSKFNFNSSIDFALNGLIQEYENSFRKGFFNINISGNANLKNYKISDFINYDGTENEYFEIDATFQMLNNKNLFEIRKIKTESLDVVNSRLEFDYYSKDRDYLVELFLNKLDVDKISFNLPSELQKQNEDLFKLLFYYLKLRNFSYINADCLACKIGQEEYRVNLKTSITNGALELENFEITSDKIDALVSGTLDIKNPQNNIANLVIEVGKWNDFNFESFGKISSIIKDYNLFKIPSFSSFNGVVYIYMQDIKNKFNQIDFLELRLRLSSGVLKQTSSRIVINKIPMEDFIKFEADLTKSIPTIIASGTLPSVKSEGLLSLILNEEKFDDIKGNTSIGFGISTIGIAIKDLIANANAVFELRSNRIMVQKFGIDSIAKVLSNPQLSFKNITNKEIEEKINDTGSYELSSKISFAGNSFSIENLELKSDFSSNLFVGKLNLLPENKHTLQLIGKTATSGADLNKMLKGIMPVYLTCAITSAEEGRDVKYDLSQINKYADARRVLFK
jgi:hypothetical protein